MGPLVNTILVKNIVWDCAYILHQHISDTADIREQKTRKSNLRARPSANDLLNTGNFKREHKVETNKSKNLKTAKAVQAKGHNIQDKESKMKDNKVTNRVSCDKVQSRGPLT